MERMGVVLVVFKGNDYGTSYFGTGSIKHSTDCVVRKVLCISVPVCIHCNLIPSECASLRDLIQRFREMDCIKSFCTNELSHLAI